MGNNDLDKEVSCTLCQKVISTMEKQKQITGSGVGCDFKYGGQRWLREKCPLRTGLT